MTVYVLILDYGTSNASDEVVDAVYANLADAERRCDDENTRQPRNGLYAARIGVFELLESA
jgi:hypothetical protein